MSVPLRDPSSVDSNSDDLMSYLRNFSSSLQRIEGHYAEMDMRTSAILDRVTNVETQVNPIVQSVDALGGRMSALFDRVTAVEQLHSHHPRGSVDGGVAVASPRPYAITSTGGGWVCPICRSGVLRHAESFKGHIRKLLPGKCSSRPKCRWKSNDDNHIRLVSRFEGATFEDRCNAFVKAFYTYLQAATSSSRSDIETTQLITEWLEAVMSSDGRPLPTLPHFSSGSQSESRKMKRSSDSLTSSN